MSDIKLSEKVDNLSPAEMKETSIRTKRLLAISRWPMFLGVGCVWILFIAIPAHLITNVAVFKVFVGVGLLGAVLLLITMERMKQCLLGNGFALRKGEIGVFQGKKLLFWISFFLMTVIVACVTVLRKTGTPPTQLAPFFWIVLNLVCLCWMIYCFYLTVALRLWEFIPLGIATSLLCDMTYMNPAFMNPSHSQYFFGAAIILIGLSFMRKWFIWRNSVEAQEGRESE